MLHIYIVIFRVQKKKQLLVVSGIQSELSVMLMNQLNHSKTKKNIFNGLRKKFKACIYFDDIWVLGVVEHVTGLRCCWSYWIKFRFNVNMLGNIGLNFSFINTNLCIRLAKLLFTAFDGLLQLFYINCSPIFVILCFTFMLL